MARKRFQKGHLLHKGGNWYVRYKDNIVESDGKIRRKLLFKKLDVPDDREHRTKASVRAIAAKFLTPINEGTQDVQSSMRVVDFVDKKYIPEHVSTLRPASQRQYKGVWNAYIKNRVGDTTLRDFETLTGETILRRIASETKACRSSLKHCKAFLSGVFSEAIRLGVLKATPNPMRETKVPEKPDTEETYAYSTLEVQAMLRVLPEPARTIVFTAAYTGVRKSELWGLQWHDFDGRTLKIQRGIWNGFNSDPKTAKSKASIPVLGSLGDALELHRIRMGKLAAPESPIFQAGTGAALNLDNLVRRTITPALNRCKLCRKPLDEHPTEGHLPERDTSLPEWHGWHSFRRGLATVLHDRGVDDKTIQSILRHSDVRTTQNIYVKSAPKMAERALESLNESLTFTDLSLNPDQREI
jgi:integrase